MKSKIDAATGINTQTARLSRFQIINIIRSEHTTRMKLELIWRRVRNGVTNIPVYFLLIAMSFVFLLPFVYMILRSMMMFEDIMNSTMVKWLPRQIYLENYTVAMQSLDYWNKLWTSIWTTGLSVIGQLITCTFVAYGLARINFKGRGFIFGLVIFTLIVPPQVTIAPFYIMFSPNSTFNTLLNTTFFDWTESFWPTIVPSFFGMGLSGGLFVFIYRQYFRGMPAELENAALIDGCGIFSSYFRIILPNAKSPMLVALILSMVWQWNNFFEPSIFITKITEKGNLPMQLNAMGSNLDVMSGSLNGAVEMASTFLVIAPIVLIFFLLQNQFMKGIERVGLAN